MGKSHDWSGDGEHCVKCGDSDWYADVICSESKGDNLIKSGWVKTDEGWYYQKGFDVHGLTLSDAIKLNDMINSWKKV